MQSCMRFCVVIRPAHQPLDLQSHHALNTCSPCCSSSSMTVLELPSANQRLRLPSSDIDTVSQAPSALPSPPVLVGRHTRGLSWLLGNDRAFSRTLLEVTTWSCPDTSDASLGIVPCHPQLPHCAVRVLCRDRNHLMRVWRGTQRGVNTSRISASTHHTGETKEVPMPTDVSALREREHIWLRVGDHIIIGGRACVELVPLCVLVPSAIDEREGLLPPDASGGVAANDGDEDVVAQKAAFRPLKYAWVHADTTTHAPSLVLPPTLRLSTSLSHWTLLTRRVRNEMFLKAWESIYDSSLLYPMDCNSGGARNAQGVGTLMSTASHSGSVGCSIVAPSLSVSYLQSRALDSSSSHFVLRHPGQQQQQLQEVGAEEKDKQWQDTLAETGPCDLAPSERESVRSDHSTSGVEATQEDAEAEAAAAAATPTARSHILVRSTEPSSLSQQQNKQKEKRRRATTATSLPPSMPARVGFLPQENGSTALPRHSSSPFFSAGPGNLLPIVAATAPTRSRARAELPITSSQCLVSSESQNLGGRPAHSTQGNESAPQKGTQTRGLFGFSMESTNVSSARVTPSPHKSRHRSYSNAESSGGPQQRLPQPHSTSVHTYVETYDENLDVALANLENFCAAIGDGMLSHQQQQEHQVALIGGMDEPMCTPEDHQQQQHRRSLSGTDLQQKRGKGKNSATKTKKGPGKASKRRGTSSSVSCGRSSPPRSTIVAPSRASLKRRRAETVVATATMGLDAPFAVAVATAAAEKGTYLPPEAESQEVFFKHT